MMGPRLIRVLCAWLVSMPLATQPAPEPVKDERAPNTETLHYGIEWRLIRAGAATLTRGPHNTAAGAGWQGDLGIRSAGLVSKLYKVDDQYSSILDDQFCTFSTFLKAQEGSRRRETRITFDRDSRKLSYLERDLVKNTVVLSKEMDIPECVHDVVGALNRLRALRPEPGQVVHLPMSDGKKLVTARIEAQEREEIGTPLGKFKTIRYEAFLFNNVLYSRKGRLFVWISDDERRLPVQIRVRLQLYIGTITLQLEKES